jgi:hypothetical protein
LQSLDRPFDVMTYLGGKHGLVRMPQQGRHYYEMVLRFFERELAEGAAGADFSRALHARKEQRSATLRLAFARKNVSRTVASQLRRQ